MGIFDKLFGPSEVKKLIEKRDIEGLIKKLEEANYSDSHIIEALGQLGDERAVEALIKALEKEDGQVSCICIAASALGKVGDERAVEPLIKALGDIYREWKTAGFSATVSMFATRALQQMGEPAIEPLIEALESDHKDIAASAAFTLGMIKDSRAAEPLIKALGIKYWRTRENASTALEMIGEPAVEPLTKALDDENKDVREAAKKILKKIQKK